MRKIKEFQNKINIDSILLSKLNEHNFNSIKVLIVDCIGLLTKLYSYSDISYVGGAMGGSGMHNVLEPAIFKTPIIIGKNYKNFPEAKEMINRNGVISVKNSTDFNCAVNELINKKEMRLRMGNNNFNFIKDNLGATKNVVSYLKEKK